MAIEVIPNAAPVGAQIVGLDLRQPPDDQAAALLRTALDDHGMIFIRDQHITPAQYLAFCRRLGELQRHALDQFLLEGQPEILVLSNVVEDGRQLGVADAGQYWHTDGAFSRQPHIYSSLHAQEIPVGEDGGALGDTMFVSTVHAFRTLPAPLQDKLRSLQGTHSLIAQYEKKKNSGIGRHVPLTDAQKARNPDLLHPLVWRHPRSGKECLYVNEGTTFGIDGMDATQAEELIRMLCDHIVQPGLIHRHHWRVGDILVWDNFSTQHKVSFDFGPQHRRRMHRTTLG